MFDYQENNVWGSYKLWKTETYDANVNEYTDLISMEEVEAAFGNNFTATGWWANTSCTRYIDDNALGAGGTGTKAPGYYNDDNLNQYHVIVYGELTETKEHAEIDPLERMKDFEDVGGKCFFITDEIIDDEPITVVVWDFNG